MKKRARIVFVVFVIFALAGCGGGKDTLNAESTSPNVLDEEIKDNPFAEIDPLNVMGGEIIGGDIDKIAKKINAEEMSEESEGTSYIVKDVSLIGKKADALVFAKEGSIIEVSYRLQEGEEGTDDIPDLIDAVDGYFGDHELISRSGEIGGVYYPFMDEFDAAALADPYGLKSLNETLRWSWEGREISLSYWYFYSDTESGGSSTSMLSYE